MSQTLSYETPARRPSAITPMSVMKMLGPFVGLALVFALFSFLRPRTFYTTANVQLMIMQTAVVGTAALGMTLIIISGGIDLSVGSAVGLGTIVIALLVNQHVPLLLAALGGVGVGVASGFVTGNLVIGQIGRVYAVAIAVGTLGALNNAGVNVYLVWATGLAVFAVLIALNELFLKNLEFVKKLNVVPFIATLGMLTIVRGMAHWLGDNGTVDTPRGIWLNNLLRTLSPGQGWQIFPPGVWLMIALAVGVAIMLRYTQFGRHIYAVGSNEQTARLCGVNVERVKVLVYVIGVGCAGVASLLQFSYLRGGDSTTGVGMELNIIAAVVIGGASLSGGEGGVLGSLIGALLMTAVANGCTKMGWDTYVQEIVTGAIIIIAAQADRLRHLKST
jgi:ribose/xylose/arabinose/galactoside ABC-type transport system permease subunit